MARYKVFNNSEIEAKVYLDAEKKKFVGIDDEGLSFYGYIGADGNFHLLLRDPELFLMSYPREWLLTKEEASQDLRLFDVEVSDLIVRVMNLSERAEVTDVPMGMEDEISSYFKDGSYFATSVIKDELSYQFGYQFPYGW